MIPTTEGAPLPNGAADGKKGVEVTEKNSSGNFGEITFSHPGVYEYEIQEKQPASAIPGLVNTRVSVILIYIGIMLPMTIYLMRNFMKTVPDSLLEAAEIDGCSKRKALTKIMIPLSVPALITSSLVNLVWVWNELLISLVFLQKEELRTLIRLSST